MSSQAEGRPQPERVDGEGGLPRRLEPVQGVLDPLLVERAVWSLGPRARASSELLSRGIVTPSALTPLTLLLLSGQPRRDAQGGRGATLGARAVAGGVWVRERITYHRPVLLGSELVTTGEISRRVARKGRLFTTSRSETRDRNGRLLVTSCTTGLSRYLADPELADREEGRPETSIPVPGADPADAPANPSRPRLASLRSGERFAGAPIYVTLELLQGRDGKRGGNPIHTDPEIARREGLPAPIAGGAHVLGFLQETLMEALGAECLLHGASFDVRFVAPVPTGTRATPRAEVTRVGETGVELAVETVCRDRSALLGHARIPLS